jgi:hypothetical protein
MTYNEHDFSVLKNTVGPYFQEYMNKGGNVSSYNSKQAGLLFELSVCSCAMLRRGASFVS